MMAAFTTYADWYNLPENDPYHGDYSQLFPTMAVRNRNAVQALTTAITLGADTKSTFAFLGADSRIHFIHRIRRYSPSFGMPATPNDNHDFGTFDDITLTGPSTIEVPADFFSPIANTVPVLTPACIDQRIADHPNESQYQPDPVEIPRLLAANEMSEVRPRHCTLVPPNLAGRTLAAITAPGGLSPRDLWMNIIAPLARDPADLVTYAPFIEWGRVAYAHGQNHHNILAIDIPPPRHLDAALGAERRRIFALDFPHLAAGAVPGVAPLVAELAAARQDAADRDARRHLHEQQQKVAAALPSKRWGAGLMPLLRLCQVPVETELPPVWLEMARNGAKADIITVRAHLLTPQPTLGPSGHTSPPVCTMDMAKTLGRLEFQTHRDAIDGGIHIFGVCHPTQECVTHANEIAGLYAEQVQGVTGLLLTDTIALKKAQALQLPTNLLELKHVLFGHHRFIATILGLHHPVVTSLGTLTARFQEEEMTLHLYFQGKTGTCASVLRFVQLRMFAWIDSQSRIDTICPPPDFASVLDQIALDCWVPPSLPPAYLTKPTRPAAGTPPTPATNRVPKLPKTGSGPNPATATDLYFDADPKLLDPALKAPKQFNTKSFIAEHGPPPTNDSNGAMCLNFHARHRCRSDCDRSADHRTHSSAETARLNAYLNPTSPPPPKAPGVGRYDSEYTPPLKRIRPSKPPPLPYSPTSPPLLHLDRLGKLVSTASSFLLAGGSFRALCIQHRGPSCLADPSSLPHPAATLLRRLRRFGAIALQSSAPWTLARLDQAIARGPHPSTNDSAAFLRTEFADMVEAGHWLVLPYSLVRSLPGLRLSPTGVVPQRDRRDRTIVDFTFSGVNPDTVSLAPDSLQFGHAFPRILHHLHRADTRHGPCYLSKSDVADAFMRIWIQLSSIASLGALLPSHPNEEPLVAFPLVLPMGWVDSPNYLCAVTETIADLTNDRFALDHLATAPHRLALLADTPPLPDANCPPPRPLAIPPPLVRSRGPLQHPLNLADVFMDDFILATQLPSAHRPAVRSTLFECIDAVLRPLSPLDRPSRKEPNSVKKLLKGDAAWGTRKVILGWLLDTVRRTIELPPHRVDRLHAILDSFPTHQRRTSRRKWQRLLGELRSMVLAIPGGRGLFSQLQSVLTHSAATASPHDRLTLSPAVHHQLADLRALAADLSSRPTRWGEVVDTDPSFLGAVDACGTGMGGVWLPTSGSCPPLLWRHRFPTHITDSLITYSNPAGILTNSDLEQAGLICHADILTQRHDIREHTLSALSDNIATISRERRGSTSVDAPSAYLCRLSSLHQRHYRYRLRASYIPGPLNVMADDLSRRWDLDDSHLLDHFTTSYPQARPWQLCHLRSAMDFNTFCQQYHLEPYLSSTPDPIPWLQVFASQVRDGRISASGQPVRSSTVADALYFVAQTFTFMGRPDPRFLPATTSIDPRLSRLLKSYSKSDLPPVRVKPLPLSVLHTAFAIASATNDPLSHAAADLMWLAFFFLLRPGEYSGAAIDSHPFRLTDIQLWSGSTPVNPLSAPPADLLSSTFVSLTFATQKNGTRAEQIGHGRTLHPSACPVRCIANRILYLRTLSAPPSTYICAVGPLFQSLPSRHITSLLREACTALGNPSGFYPSNITARSLRASGATALLNRQIDRNTIQLLGRWHSDSMLRYLHLQAHSVMQDFASIMLEGGDFSLIPSVPNAALPPFG